MSRRARTATLAVGLFAALAALPAVALTAPPPAAEVTLEPREVTVGDPLTATIRVPAQGDAPPVMPDWKYGWGEAEVVSAGPVERTPTGWSQTVTLRAFRTGEIGLPPMPIRFAGVESEPALATPREAAITVRSILPAEGEVPAKPARPPVALPIGRAFWISLGVGGLTALALALMLWRRARKRRSAAEATRPALPPLDELVAALGRLPGDPLAAHVGLSAAFRRYLGRSLSIRAEEGSTPEIRRSLAQRPVPGELAQRAVDLLRDLDGVKFARRAASLDDVSVRAQRAASFAREIEARLAPPAPNSDRTKVDDVIRRGTA